MNGTVCRIVHDPIDIPGVLAQAAAPSDGAVLLFLGVVRDENGGRAVQRLEYEAYSAMAESVLRDITTEAHDRWPVGRIQVVHRIGTLEVGECSVAVAVASPHRVEAYEASRYIIEELKRRVPVWKREGYVTGASEWVPGYEPATGDDPASGGAAVPPGGHMERA